MGRLSKRPALLCSLQRRPDDAADLDSDLVLKIENVVEGAIEVLGPKMRSSRSIDELPSYADPVSRLAHAAFEHITHPELAPDLFYVHGAAFVSEARIARYHEQLARTRQRRNDFLHHAVGEILLLGIATHVLKWQDGNRRLVWQRERRNLTFRRCRPPAGIDDDAINVDRPRDILQSLLARILDV